MTNKDVLYFISCLFAFTSCFFIAGLFFILILDANAAPKREVSGIEIPGYALRLCYWFLAILLTVACLVGYDWINDSFALHLDAGRIRNFGIGAITLLSGLGMFHSLYMILKKFKRNL